MTLKNITLSLALILTGCGDTGSVGPAGPAGTAGPIGEPGINGLTTVFKLTKAAVFVSLCASEIALVVEAGLDLNNNLVLDSGEVTQINVVCDGEQGVQGPQGDPGTPAPQYQIVSIIDPCGDTHGIVDEVLLRLAGGEILVLMMDNPSGLNARLSILSTGSYMTTDGSHCAFHINASNVLTDQNGGVFNP